MTASKESKFGFTLGLGPGGGCRALVSEDCNAGESVLLPDPVEVEVLFSTLMLVGTKAAKKPISKTFRRSIDFYLLVLSYP